MHADFCITNVVITDVILLLLDSVEFRQKTARVDAFANHSNQTIRDNFTEVGRTCLVIKEVSVGDLPDALADEEFADGKPYIAHGLGIFKFRTEKSSREMAEQWTEEHG